MSYRFNCVAGTHMPDPETQKKSSRRCRPLVTFVTILLIMAIVLQLSGCQAIRRDKPIETVDTPEIKTEDTPEDAVLSGSTEYPESASSEETTVIKTSEAAPPPAPPESETVLTETSAGISAAPPFICNYYMYVTGVDYYLALRTAKSYDAANEIGRIFNGEAVEVLDSTTGTYWYVYAPTLGKKGYVNSKYLTSYSNVIPQNDTYTVHGVDYYLALRTAPEYDGNNEIGKIYNGQTVEVISMYDTYWYVYAPTLDCYGYVNSNYLQ